MKIFQALLFFLIVFSILPIVIIILQSIQKLDEIKTLSKETGEKIVEQQTAHVSILEAQCISEKITDFLFSCEQDLHALSLLPLDSETFLRFSQTHSRKNPSFHDSIPLYAEIAYIDAVGQEIIKIADNRIVSSEQLRNISDPSNTTFKSENYFEKTKINPSEIYVSHLTGWCISRREQIEQGRLYTGVFRFCKKARDDKGRFKGLYMIALDHRHIMAQVYPETFSTESLIEKYKSGNYNYLIDDEGWIIAHPKLWDIRGLDRDGNPVEPLSDQTTKWKLDSGLIPINLLNMDWRLRDVKTGEPMSNIVRRVQRGETVAYTMHSSGIYNEMEGIVRTRACTPILYPTGEYAKHGIWGGVVVGTAMDHLIEKTDRFSAKIHRIVKKSNLYILALALLLSVILVTISFIITKSISKFINKTNRSLQKIAQGDYNIHIIKSPLHEITAFSTGVQSLAQELQAKEDKIKTSIKELESLNQKLEGTQKDLDSYWKQEYEIESTDILEEKLHSYEKEYPKLKAIRQNLYIGTSPYFLKVLRQIVPLSQMTIPVWIFGETGVGKSALGSAMHALSPRSEKPLLIFEAIEFSAADPMIVMGKLFGFGENHGLAGIDKNGQQGILEECAGGTLIIDDVDALPLETQAKLLRVVDGLSFHPAAGKTRAITPDIRLIFVSNVDLEQKVKEGSFRKDLFRRMGGNINKIIIPPLRKRKPDIPPITLHLIGEYNRKHGTTLQIKEQALQTLTEYDYQEGNIGELKMIVELACEHVRIEGKNYIEKRDLAPLLNSKRAGEGLSKQSFYDDFFNLQERRMLQIMRTNKFNMATSEFELGYQKGSKTLSHHLRGICLKTLSKTRWDIEQAIAVISDHNGDSDQIRLRIQGYLQNIKRNCANGKKLSLYKNLPKEYHSFLAEAAARFSE
ncbi:sigma 54-interacting transcriptional regulator [candidate division KSB1 bacterium]|nr:sigma 54-interacting transcriptional regulator [candidate division KSB1 bacterium]